MHAGVVEVPQLGPLIFRVPLPEGVPKREDSLLRARFFLVAAGAAYTAVEAEFFDRIEQRHGLMAVAAFVEPREQHAPARDRILDRAHYQPLAQLCRAPIAKRDHFRKIVPCVDVQQWEWKRPGAESLFREAQEHQRILAAGEEEGGVAALAGDFAQDMDRLGFEPAEMMDIGRRRPDVAVDNRRLEEGGVRHDGTLTGSTRTATSSGRRCRPHSRCSGCSHHQRPPRMSSPGSTARVHGAQPMLG